MSLGQSKSQGVFKGRRNHAEQPFVDHRSKMDEGGSDAVIQGANRQLSSPVFLNEEAGLRKGCPDSLCQTPLEKSENFAFVGGGGSVKVSDAGLELIH